MSAEDALIKFIGVQIYKKNIDIDQHMINYIYAGTGRPLLMIHGANIGWGQWYPNISALSTYFKVYAIDLPGSGSSSRIHYKKSNFEKDYVNVVEGFVKKLNLGKIDIIAHSFGASVALSMLVRKKIKINKVILVNPMGFTRSVPVNQKLLGLYPVAKLLSKTVMKPTRNNIRNFLMSVMKEKSAVREEFVDYYFEQINRHNDSHPFLFINSLIRNFRVRNELIFLDDLLKLKIPILVVIGSRDNMLPKSILYHMKLLPNGRVEVFDDAGHVPSLEYSQKFNNKVLEFLRS